MLEIIEPFFRAIAWPMEPPRAYGAFHILFTVTGFFVCGFSAWKLRNIGSKAFGCILFFCGLFLSLSEVLMQHSHVSMPHCPLVKTWKPAAEHVQLYGAV